MQRFGWGDWGLSFVGYLHRGHGMAGCYLTRTRETQPAVDVYEDVKRSLEGFRKELGDELEHWEHEGRPRIGFRRPTQFPFAPEGDTAGKLLDAVAWMREGLDLLVSSLHPTLQRLMSAKN